MEENTRSYDISPHQNRNIYFPEREITFDDLKFVCYMIERTARRIKQPNAYVVDHVGKDELLRNLSLADVLHSENPDDVADRWMTEEKTILYHRALARYKHPTHQIVFCTPEALTCISYKGHYAL